MNGQYTTLDGKQDAEKLLFRPNCFANVVGVGIGTKAINGATKECVRIYVVRKEPYLTKLSPEALVPPDFNGIPTDVIEVGRFGRTGNKPKPNPDYPLGPGHPIRVETNVPNVNSGFRGTLAAVVRDDAGKRYILSCNHVLRVNGRVPDGAEIVSAVLVEGGKTIAKPGAYIRLKPPDAGNPVDCALGEMDPSASVRTTHPEIGTLSTNDPIEPEFGRAVKKAGAATGVTNGKIVDVDVDLYVDYSFGTFRFDHQVMIDGESDTTDFAALGDSGSLVVAVDNDNKPIGATAMIFAASGRFAVACRLTEVFKQLENAPEAKVRKLSLVV